jgi:hypothetical protein
VNDIGKDEALRFHALNFGDVLVGDQDALYVGIGDTIGGHSVKPAELAGLGTQAATARDTVIVSGRDDRGEFLLDAVEVGTSVKAKERFADEFMRRIAENAGKIVIYKKEFTGRRNDGEELSRGGQKSTGLELRTSGIGREQQAF